MLNNFIYARTKDLFLEQLNAGNILDEAIVFIEDTGEIWNHGTYFGGNAFDPSDIESSIANFEEEFASFQTTTNSAISSLESTKLNKNE